MISLAANVNAITEAVQQSNAAAERLASAASPAASGNMVADIVTMKTSYYRVAANVRAIQVQDVMLDHLLDIRA